MVEIKTTNKHSNNGFTRCRLIYIGDINSDGGRNTKTKNRAYVVIGMAAAGTKRTNNFLEQPLEDEVQNLNDERVGRKLANMQHSS